MKASVKFVFQCSQNESLTLDARFSSKGDRNHAQIEVRLAAVTPTGVSTMSLRLVDQFQRQGFEKAQLVANSVRDAIAHKLTLLLGALMLEFGLPETARPIILN